MGRDRDVCQVKAEGSGQPENKFSAGVPQSLESENARERLNTPVNPLAKSVCFLRYELPRLYSALPQPVRM